MTHAPTIRPRRMRRTPALRRLAAETRLHPAELILPAFVREGITSPREIPSMPGTSQHTLDSLRRAAAEAAEADIGGIMLFGVPEKRDALGRAADDPQGILNAAARAVAAEVGDVELELIFIRARLSHCDSALGCTFDGRCVDSRSQRPYFLPSAAICTMRSVSRRSISLAGSGEHRLCASSITISRPTRSLRLLQR